MIMKISAKNTILIYIFLGCLFFSCSDDKKTVSLEDNSDSFFFNLNATDYIYGENLKGFLNIMFNEKKYSLGTPNSIFNSNGELLSTEFVNSFGELIISEFKNGQISHTEKRIWIPKPANYFQQDLIVYDNGFVDKSKGDFVFVDLLSEKNDTIELQIEYFSCFNFLEGTLFFGDEIDDYADTNNLESIPMKSTSMKIKLPRSKVVFGNNDEFHCMVKIVTDTLVQSEYTYRLYDGRDKWVKRFIVRKNVNEF